MDKIPVQRGDIYYARLDVTEGSTQRGTRPVIITQINRLNGKSSTYLCAPVTTRIKKAKAPYHVVLPKIRGLGKTSMVLAEHRFAISRTQLLSRVGHISKRQMKKITKAVRWAESEGYHKWKSNTFKSYKYKNMKRRQHRNRKKSNVQSAKS